jgi:hypothetical protein
VKKTLRELIGEGQYELAAHRLVYGVLRARLSEPPVDGDGGPPHGSEAGTVWRERREDGVRG